MNDARLNGIIVLIVDCNPDSLDLSRRALESYGAVVLTANCATESLRIIENAHLDVLLSEIDMPEMDGYELITKIRKLENQMRLTNNEDAHVPAVAITSLTEADVRRKSILAGFRAHISRPFDIADLVTAVANLAGRPEPGSIA